jgi:hypothetical protein
MRAYLTLVGVKMASTAVWYGVSPSSAVPEEAYVQTIRVEEAVSNPRRRESDDWRLDGFGADVITAAGAQLVVPDSVPQTPL